MQGMCDYWFFKVKEKRDYEGSERTQIEHISYPVYLNGMHSSFWGKEQVLGLQPARLLCPWDSPGKNIGVGYHYLLQGSLPSPGIEPMSPALAGRFFTTEPPGKLLNNSFMIL